MTDHFTPERIAELRSLCEWQQNQPPSDIRTVAVAVQPLLIEALDEIERLTAERDSALAALRAARHARRLWLQRQQDEDEFAAAGQTVSWEEFHEADAKAGEMIDNALPPEEDDG